MSSKKWGSLTEDEKGRVYACPVGELTPLAEELGCSYATALYQHGNHLAPIVAGKTPVLTDWRTLTGDALIISDVHLPRHDSTFATQVLNLASAWGLRQCVIAEDLYDMDNVGPFLPEQPSPSTADELDAGAEFLGRLGQQFERVLWIAGNHDVRLIKLALRALGLDPARLYKLMGAVDKIEASPYHHCRLVSNGRVWLVEHPKNASICPGAVGMKLAAKFLCNVICAHGHTVGYQRDASGKFTIIDSGGLFGLDRLPYVSLCHSTRPAMNQGAVIVHRGIGYLVDPLNCDIDLLAWMGQRASRK